MFSWLRTRWKGFGSAELAAVEFDERQVTCRRPDGTSETVTWDDLTQVEILTTDAGPYVCDVFWVLHGRTGGCVVPDEAAGRQALLARLQQLPGFDNRAVIEAMGCTATARFLVWRRAAAADAAAGV